MLTDLDLIAIVIAFAGLILVISLFYKQIVSQEKEIYRLRKELRKALKV